MLGGVTTVFDMPNTNPPIADLERLNWKRDYAEQRSWCDIGLYVAGAALAGYVTSPAVPAGVPAGTVPPPMPSDWRAICLG